MSFQKDTNKATKEHNVFKGKIVSFIRVVYTNFNCSQFFCVFLAQMDLDMEAMQAQCCVLL